jgi:hypothetical protein
MTYFDLDVLQSPYGDPVEPEKAPEAISRAVASLPPEQMFELMKQMKVEHLINLLKFFVYNLCLL